jgi:hypothetical protein
MSLADVLDVMLLDDLKQLAKKLKLSPKSTRQMYIDAIISHCASYKQSFFTTESLDVYTKKMYILISIRIETIF